MIQRVPAIRYDRQAQSGRTQPLLIAIETHDGEERDVFLKPSAAPGLDVEGLANEALAACVAGELGLPICQPYLVELSPDWIASVQDQQVRGVLAQSCSVAFGSTAAGTGWRPWAATDTLTPDRREMALRIFAFDALIENPDRRPSNPNVLLKGPAFRIFDHEMAFRLRMLIPRSQPWSIGGLNRLAGPDSHVFQAALRGARNLDLDPIRTAWSGLSDDHLADFEASLPGEWATAANAVTDALTHLRAVRDRIGECVAEIERILT